MSDSPANQVELSNGSKFQFGPLMAGDLLDAVQQLGQAIEAAPPYEASMVLTWRSAVRGGFQGTFREFVDAIPMQEVEAVVSAAQPFLSPTSK